MTNSEWILESLLIVLLVFTLIHAIRLERALGILRRDKVGLEQLITHFNASTNEAETGVTKLRSAAEGVGRQLTRHIESAHLMQNDIRFLIERAERVADRLDGLIQTRRGDAHLSKPVEPNPDPALRSQAERDLLKALKLNQ